MVHRTDMKKISGSTFFMKRLFPAIWFGALIAFFVGALRSGEAPPTFYVMPILMAAGGVIVFRKLAWDLADEVWDAGDHLVFRKGDIQQTVRFSDVINIDYSATSSPRRIVVHVRSAGPLGNDLAFSPPASLTLSSKSPLVTDLIDRVDRARRLPRS